MGCSNTRVGQVCSVLTCLVTSVTALSVISAPRALSTAFTNSPLVNASILDVTIDPRFGLKAEYGETNISLTPCLMNTVELLAQYAELDWMSKERQRHGVVLPEYPQVEIAILPAAPATSIEVRLIMWGIWVSIRDMIRRNKFREAEFEILWEREVVAFIYFTKPMDLQATSSNRTSGTDEPLTLLPGPNGTVSGIRNSTENSPDALNVGRFSWTPFFTPTAKTLTVLEVFLTVMAGLKNAGPHAATDKVPGPYASAAIDVFANIQFYLHRRRHPRPRPPYFQYIHIIKALRLVPRYMLEQGRFAELFFSIEVGHMQVGEGYLEKGHYVPPRFFLGDMLGPIDNVSLS